MLHKAFTLNCKRQVAIVKAALENRDLYANSEHLPSFCQDNKQLLPKSSSSSNVSAGTGEKGLESPAVAMRYTGAVLDFQGRKKREN